MLKLFSSAAALPDGIKTAAFAVAVRRTPVLPWKAPSLDFSVVNGARAVLVPVFAREGKAVEAVVVDVCMKNDVFFALIAVNDRVVQSCSKPWHETMGHVSVLGQHAVLLGYLPRRLVDAETGSQPEGIVEQLKIVVVHLVS